MNKRNIIVAVIFLVVVLFIGGCSSNNSANAASNSRFITNDGNVSISTFSDSKTGVEYAIVRDYVHSDIEIIVLQNADGTPKVK